MIFKKTYIALLFIGGFMLFPISLYSEISENSFCYMKNLKREDSLDKKSSRNTNFNNLHNARTSLNFNREWLFKLGDFKNASRTDFNDTGWESMNLPHSFSIPYFAADRFYVGYGWYRKHFKMPVSIKEKKVFIEFDGVFQVAELFVNGKFIGIHKGGYTGFSFDITRLLKRGDNVIAIRVNNIWDPQLAPRAGEHTFSGGIYRNVRLIITNPVHVTWYGTFVTTPQLSKSSGKVNIKTEVVNSSEKTKSVTLVSSIQDKNGILVGKIESTKEIPSNSVYTFDQTSSPINNPKLWSPQSPNMYVVKTVVKDKQQVVDDYMTPFGFRWFKWTADKGFFLNGKHYYFRGANVHQDHAGWGDAVTDAGFYRDVKMVKEAGLDFIRGSHYPHSPAFATACDKLGILFCSENCFWGTANFKNPWGASAYPTDSVNDLGFEASVKASLRDMIRINRNHPSIVLWSMDNEVFFCERKVMPKVRKLLKELVDYTHKLDPTRPATINGAQRGEIDKIGDVAGYNGDGARLPEFINPGIPNFVSEYGSTMVDRPGKYAPGWGDLTEISGVNPNDFNSWHFPWRSGEVLWCAFDHGSIAGRKFGSMGFVDYFRLPKRQWYWYRNAYRGIAPPKWPENGIPYGLELSADKKIIKSVNGTDDSQIIVTVVDRNGIAISNCPEVTLSVISGPGQFPTGPSITFSKNSDIAIRDGKAAIEFRSYYAGETVIRASSPGLKNAIIKITSLGYPKYVEGKTPKVKPRPYICFTEKKVDPRLIAFGQSNPTRTSSEVKGHSGLFANDGNVATFWKALPADKDAWLAVDMERIVKVHSIKLVFPVKGNWRYILELSDDGETKWKKLVDQSQTTDTNKERIDNVQAVGVVSGRFLRIKIIGTPEHYDPALSEITVIGAL